MNYDIVNPRSGEQMELGEMSLFCVWLMLRREFFLQHCMRTVQINPPINPGKTWIFCYWYHANDRGEGFDLSYIYIGGRRASENMDLGIKTGMELVYLSVQCFIVTFLFDPV